MFVPGREIIEVMEKGDLGLAGLGRAGEWIVELNEDAEGQLALTFEHPRVLLQLPLMSESQIQLLVESVIQRRAGKIGMMFGATWYLEFYDGGSRLRLQRDAVLLEMRIADSEFEGLREAVRDACRDAELFSQALGEV